MEELLKAVNIKKSFTVEKMMFETKESVRALDDVSFQMNEKNITAVAGESGSGKTTLARCIAGLETPDSGTIFFRGREIDYKDMDIRRKIQYIFQDTYSSLSPRMKIKAIIAEPLEFHFGYKGGILEKNIRRCMEMVNLSGNLSEKYPHELSGGQRQRAGMARALAMEPDLLIADEPVSSLDVSIQAQILKLLVELNRDRGIGIIFITHDLRIVKNLAHDIMIMKDGKAVETGSVDSVYADPRSSYTKLLLSSIPGSPYK
ncbi:MAG: ABC transporter ATP-binding protein [Candidatus Goldiibacteriota bacterium]